METKKIDAPLSLVIRVWREVLISDIVEMGTVYLGNEILSRAGER